MKRFLHGSLKTLGAVLLAIWCGPVYGDFSVPPDLVKVGVHTAYIPSGFDDNDRAQVVVEGIFSDSCFRVGPHEVDIDRTNKIITVYQTAYRYSGICLTYLVPFYSVVDLGLLNAGEFKVVDGVRHAALGSLPVTVARGPDPDDYFYAPVSDARVVSRDGKQEILISGNLPDDCLAFQQIIVQQENKNVISVRPVIEKIDRNDCHEGAFAYQQSAPLPDLTKGRYLLHVRSLNGQAVNKLVDIY